MLTTGLFVGIALEKPRFDYEKGKFEKPRFSTLPGKNRVSVKTNNASYASRAISSGIDVPYGFRSNSQTQANQCQFPALAKILCLSE